MSNPEQTINSIAEKIRAATDEQSVIVLIRHKNNSVSMLADGCGHAVANEMLALGIHINMKQYDAKVLAGEAGADAQAIAKEIEAANA